MSAPASAWPVPSRAGTRRASLCSSRQTASRSTGRGRPWPTGTAGGPPGDRWSSTFLLLAFLQGEPVGRFAEAVILLHDDLVVFVEKVDQHCAPRLAGQTSPLDQFGDYVLLKLLGNATGTEAERSGLVEHHQVPAFVLQANGVHSRPYRFLQHTDEFLKCPVRVLGVIWHDASSSWVRLLPWPARPGAEDHQSYDPTSARCPGPGPGCRLASSGAGAALGPGPQTRCWGSPSRGSGTTTPTPARARFPAEGDQPRVGPVPGRSHGSLDERLGKNRAAGPARRH